MTDYEVTIPDEQFVLAKFTQEELPGIVLVNSSLVDFEPKVVFGWHLSLVIDFAESSDNGMPSRFEQKIVDRFGERLEHAFNRGLEKPNALLLARLTWNETRQLLYRVYEPDPVHQLLQRIIDSEDHPRPFDYRIDPDPEWKLATWYLDACKK